MYKSKDKDKVSIEDYEKNKKKLRNNKNESTKFNLIIIGILYSFALFLVRIIEYFIPSTKHEKKENINELIDKNVFQITIIKYGAYTIPLFFIASEVKHFTRDYYWIKMKSLNKYNSLKLYKIKL